MTKPLDLNLDLFAEFARAKAATMQSERHRRMIDVYIEHATAEVAGDMDRLMPTMCADPQFHVWVNGTDIGPKGYDAVHAMYLNLIDTCSNYFQIDIQRMVVDDDCLVKEYIQTNLMPGTNFVTGTRAGMLEALGMEPDPEGHYMTQGRVLVMIPFDADCRIMGEDSFTAGRSTVRKLAEGELPQSYRARLSI